MGDLIARREEQEQRRRAGAEAEFDLSFERTRGGEDRDRPPRRFVVRRKEVAAAKSSSVGSLTPDTRPAATRGALTMWFTSVRTSHDPQGVGLPRSSWSTWTSTPRAVANASASGSVESRVIATGPTRAT